MSYKLKIGGRERAAGRFIGQVRKAITLAALEEKKASGVTQQRVAEKLGVNRSVVNRIMRGETNLTLRAIAEIAWALGWEPEFNLRRRTPAPLANHVEPQPFGITVTASTNNIAQTSPPAATGASRLNRVEHTYAG